MSTASRGHISVGSSDGSSGGTSRPMCRHCKREPVTRPRGLGWKCFYAPGVRGLYPSTSIYARRGTANFFHEAPLPSFATQARPGTPAKMAVMQVRAALGQAIHHPDDSAAVDVRQKAV